MVIVVILIVYIIYTISLGKIDLTPEKAEGKTPEERKQKAAARHRKLEKLIARKENLKNKLDKWVRIAYLSLRILLVPLVIGLNSLLYFGFKVQSLGEIMNWNELAAISFIAINFVCYRTIAILKGVVSILRTG